MNNDDKRNKGDETMALTEIRKNIKSNKHAKKIPHLKSVKGKVIIDSKDPKQIKWFEDFKK